MYVSLVLIFVITAKGYYMIRLKIIVWQVCVTVIRENSRFETIENVPLLCYTYESRI